MNRISTLLLLFVLSITISSSCFSQSCANYGVVRSTGITYTSMGTTGTVVPYWLGQIANQNDDNRSSPVPIGFDFWYLGVRYSNVSISINGFIDFSTTSYDGNWPLGDPNPLPPGYATCGGFISYREDGRTLFNVPCGSSTPPNSFDGTYWALAPFYCDIWASNGTAAVANSIKYKTTGTAPNRIFTVEYFNMDDWASAATSDYNFQIKLYETSGIIDFQYGTMNQVSGAVPYSCGLNGRILTNPPTASELLSQQADNSGTFSNTVTALHNAAPTSNSKIVFSPPCSVAPGGPLTFTAVGNTTMTLNWTDVSATELGYVVYISTDGVNYTYHAQTAANATSYAASSLFGTTYFWKVYAVTEGCLSGPISGSQATLPAGNFISVVTGNWSNGATWLAGTVPTAGDNVIINNGHVVTMDGSFSCSNLTVGQGTSGTLLLGNNTTSRTITVLGDITVMAGGSLTSNPGFAVTHVLTASGNIVNNGSINMRPVATSLTNIIFNKNGNQTISGGAVTNNYNRLTINMGASTTNTLEVTASNFSAPSNFLVMTNGTFKFSVPVSAVTLDVFTSITTIPASCALWMNSPNSTMIAHSTLNFQGGLTCSSGTMNVGDNANEMLNSNGALLTLSGGTINVSGRLDRPSFVAVTNINISGGTLNLNTVGSTSTTNAPFMVDVIGSSFNMTGGTIVIKNEGGTGGQDLGYINTGCLSNYSVTGGTLQIGNAATAASQNMQINTNLPIGNLTVNTTNSPTGTLVTNPLTVLQNVNINTSGTLNANSINMNVGGNFTNNGTFTPGTNTVTFNGTAAQQIAGTTTSTFYNLTMLNTSATGLTLNTPANLTNLLTLTSGKLFSTLTNILGLTTTASSTSGSAISFVSGPMTKAGTTAFVFPVGKGTSWRRIAIGAPSAATTFRAEYFNVPYTNTTSITTPLTDVSNFEYWTLDQAAGTGNAIVTLHWEDATASSINNCPDLTVAHWDGTSWGEKLGTATGTCSGTGAGSVSTNVAVTTFSPFTFGSKSVGVNPLPIELTRFTANVCDNEVCLDWTTLSETNNDYFTIEKTKDGSNFEFVIIIDGAGNSTSILDYTTIDNAPYEGVSYYRLKQTDFDGNYSYSGLEMIDFTNDDFTFSLFPNPSDGTTINLSLSADVGEEILVVVYDAIGRESYSKVIITQDTGGNIYAIDPSNKLAKGIYLITATSQQGIHSKKLIVK